jgi:hypothetical protein
MGSARWATLPPKPWTGTKLGGHGRIVTGSLQRHLLQARAPMAENIASELRNFSDLAVLYV